MSAPLNFQSLFELDINPGGTPNWVRLGNGLASAGAKNNEKVDQKAYLDGNGGISSTVTGFQAIFTFSGDRKPGDAAQEYILGKLYSMGDARTTQFRSTGADGVVVTGACTIANIEPPGGDANNVSSFGFEIHMNGKPTLTPAALGSSVPLTATWAAGTGTGNTKVTATPGAGNRLALLKAASLTLPNARAYIPQFTEYTSAASYAAVVGEIWHLYELDAYNHLVKAAAHTMIGGDIT